MAVKAESVVLLESEVVPNELVPNLPPLPKPPELPVVALREANPPREENSEKTPPDAAGVTGAAVVSGVLVSGAGEPNGL